MNICEQNPMNAKTMAKFLGIGRTQMTALRRAMGVTARHMFVSDVRKWMRSNPNFKTRDIYSRGVNPKRPGKNQDRPAVVAGSCGEQ